MIYVYIKVFKRLNTIHDIEVSKDEEDDGDELTFDQNKDEIAQRYNSDQFPSSEMNINSAAGSGSSYNNTNSQRQKESNEELQKKVVRKQNNTLQRMKYYPMILIICYFWATIRRIIDWATGSLCTYCIY